ncbi:MAG: hypothetical protein KatS3mg031_0341 [Chitinophagales bacterium]|nr:MAG: hypothetical protein KatS3mg031_0341 [Chitinophagales bacterium]
MKVLFRAFLISSVIFPVYITHAQQACTPDPSYTEFGIYTSDTSGLPHGCENEPYSEVITAVIPDSLGGYPLIDVTLLSVNGLPDSMGYACNPSNCVFLPNTSACILLAGIPKTAGTYSIRVSLRVKVRVIFIPVTVDTTFTLGDFVVDAKDCAGVCGGSASVDACGICSGGTTGILPDCDDNDPCTADQCDGMGGCLPHEIYA